MKVEEMWPVWEFECPSCHGINQVRDDDFEVDFLEGVRVEVAYIVCDDCNIEIEPLRIKLSRNLFPSK